MKKTKREKIRLGEYDIWVDATGYPAIWLYPSATATNGIPVDILHNGKMAASLELNEIEKRDLLNYLNKK